MADLTVKRIDEMDGMYGGAFKRARASLGVTSFGLAVIDLPANYDGYPDHTHEDDGQEEVYFALSGSGEIEVEGERFPLDAQTFVRVGPSTRRKVLPGPDGLRLLALGGVPGGAFVAHAATEIGGPQRF